jgi:lipopolysaccharide export LptBFGC system permease protein LptF
VPGVAAGLDAVAVLLFAVAGRSSHDEGVTVAGVLTTAWPFLAGAAAGWGLVRARSRRPATGPGDGAVVALVAVVVGMLLRRLTGAGTDPAFVAVATVVLGGSLVGWRAAWALVGRARAVSPR